ncbi:MAG: hypothetical protein KJ592_02170 [Nanoarchaeota archaeon]|nr:hypothetical protein [Nanoarchaeota archaeon]
MEEILVTLPFWVMVIMAWSVIWKAIASWRAARNDHVVWFILFWVLNTAGILPIVYILFFSKRVVRKVAKKKSRK